ncbi:MAG: Gfo/Idh/MocA family oxidoreductase [Pirellulales bacterium]|nr:Gfo/Idh/MocA family oxidoreductase [Pirellulales bacterium]
MRFRRIALCLFVVLGFVLAAARPARADKPLRAGIIGLDTSHAVAFTKVFNDPKATGPLADVKVVAAYPGGSPDIPSSRDRAPGFMKALGKQGIKFCDSIDELLGQVDVVLLESVDGRPHLEQVKPVFAAGKPVFIDKPVAGSLADAIEIFRLAKEHNVPCFSASSLRYAVGVHELRGGRSPAGKVVGCDAYSPCHLEPHHPDLFWYGVHGVELLFTVMGPEIESVARTHTEGTDLAVGVWKDGRIGTFRGIRQGKQDYGATIFGSKRIVHSGKYEGYQPLVVEIAKFFKTGKAPVNPEETLAIFAFMEAADQSKREGGRPVSIAEVMKKAQAELDARK